MSHCRTRYVECHREPGGRVRLAARVQTAIAELAEGGEVLDVALAPIAAGEPDGESPTAGVLVTVIARSAAER